MSSQRCMSNLARASNACEKNTMQERFLIQYLFPLLEDDVAQPLVHISEEQSTAVITISKDGWLYEVTRLLLEGHIGTLDSASKRNTLLTCSV